MDYKKTKADTTTETRRMVEFQKGTENIYESLSVLGKRANQIGLEMKEELNKKLAEFATHNDSLEEVFENREQIEIARYYERLPKPTLIAIHEYLNDRVYLRNPSKESMEQNPDTPEKTNDK